MLDFLKLKEDGITIKDIYTKRRIPTGVYVIAFMLLVLLGVIGIAIDLYWNFL